MTGLNLFEWRQGADVNGKMMSVSFCPFSLATSNNYSRKWRFELSPFGKRFFIKYNNSLKVTFIREMKEAALSKISFKENFGFEWFSTNVGEEGILRSV